MVQPPPIESVLARHHARDPVLKPTWVQTVLVIACALVAAVVHIAAESSRNPGDAFAISRAMGWMMCTVASATLVAGGVYLATRRRSLWPATITACALMLILGLVFGVGVPSIAGRTRSIAIWRDLDRVNTRTLGELRQVFDTEGGSAKVKPIMQRHAAELDRLGAGLTGDEAIALKVGAGFSRDVTTITAEYLSALQPFLKAGGLEPKTLKDKAAVTKRRAMLKAPLTMHTTILSSFRLIPQDLDNRFAKNGASEAASRKMAQGMLAGMRYNKLLQVQGMENQMLVLMDEHLADLEARWPKWKSLDDKFEFVAGIDQKILDAFNARVERLHALADQQEAIQRELLQPRSGGN